MFKFDLVDEKDKPALELFKANQVATKITYDFYVKTEFKEDFLNWLDILSCIEFGITFDDKDLYCKDQLGKTFINSDKTYIRIRIAGSEDARELWLQNIKTILKFFNDEIEIDYLKVSPSVIEK